MNSAAEALEKLKVALQRLRRRLHEAAADHKCNACTATADYGCDELSSLLFALSAALATIEADKECKESDGCPTELAVLQRFWRKQHETALASPEHCDDQRLLDWLDNPNRKPAITAFTDSVERQIAYRFEAALAKEPVSLEKCADALADVGANYAEYFTDVIKNKLTKAVLNAAGIPYTEAALAGGEKGEL